MRDSSCSITAFLAIACIQLTLFRFIILHNGPNQSRAERSERKEEKEKPSAPFERYIAQSNVVFHLSFYLFVHSLRSAQLGSVRFS